MERLTFEVVVAVVVVVVAVVVVVVAVVVNVATQKNRNVDIVIYERGNIISKLFQEMTVKVTSKLKIHSTSSLCLKASIGEKVLQKKRS